MNISMVEGSMRIRGRKGAGVTEVAQLHWQTGQGDRERRGGEEGPGLGDGESGGRLAKERGEIGREGVASWVPKDSWLGHLVVEGEDPGGGEEGVDEIGMVIGSDKVGEGEEGTKVGVVGVVVGLEEAVVYEDRLEVGPDGMTEEGTVVGSGRKGCGVGELDDGMSVGEDGTVEGEEGTGVAEEGMGDTEGELGTGVQGEVMRGMGEGEWGENGKEVD